MSAAVTEAEVTAVHAPGTDLAPYAPAAAALEEYRPRIVMEPEDAKALDDQLRACMLAVLRDTVDYGVIPGAGDKKNLLKPGAQKLLQWFGFGFTNDCTELERDGDGRKFGVTYRCTVTKEMPDGRKVTVATCEGYAGYDEDRYFTSAEQAEAKERANAERYERRANPLKFAEYRAPWNTVIKMAQKRALVGAAIDATAASGLFTQDMEDAAAHHAAPADPQAVQFRDLAIKALTALDAPVREAVGKWYRSKKWPDPRDWTAEQWTAALQAAGFIAGQRSARQAMDQQQAGQDAAQPASDEPVSDEPDPWLQKIQDITSAGEVAAVRAELLEAFRDTPVSDPRLCLLRTALDKRAARFTEEAA